MTHEQIVAWLLANRPGAFWSLTGTEYDNLLWLDTPETKPTAEEMGL